MSEGATNPAPRRGRPAITDEKREEMTTRISEAARRLFQTEGYSTVSMRRIASEIGCSPMTLYKYYDAKIDILRTLWADVFDDLFNSLDEVSQSKRTPVEALVTLSTAYVNYWLNHSDAYRLVFVADGVTQPDVSVFLDNPDIIGRYNLFASAIADACADELSADILKVKLDALVCALHGVAHNAITISGYQWADSEKILRVIIAGVIANT